MLSNKIRFKQDNNASKTSKAQIALEFLVIYSFVLAIFAILFYLIAQQGGAALAQQNYANIQLQAQSISADIQQASSAGNGYSVSIPIVYSGTSLPNISISNTGVVIESLTSGGAITKAYSFSGQGGLVINGTLVSSAGTTSIYSLPTYKGTITLFNANGTIYVDEQPPSTLNIPGRLITYLQADNNVALLNGQSSYISGNGIYTFPLTNLEWIYPISYVSSGNEIISSFDGPSSNLGTYRLMLSSTGNLMIYNGISTINSILVVPLDKWSFVGFSTNSVSTTLYLNTTNQIISSSSSSMNPSNTFWTLGWSSGYTNYFNGSISNVQLYNSILSQSQINHIYFHGISGFPNQTSNLTGWWPLDGNPNDYSGNGNSGASYNTFFYSTAAQIYINVLLNSGSVASNDIVGVISSYGISTANTASNANSMFNVYRTNSTGNATAISISSSYYGIGNSTIYAFNENSTLSSKLSAWWPLITEYVPFGNTIYDLSGNSKSGTFYGPHWRSSANVLTNIQTASFNGVSGNNWITITPNAPLTNIAINGSFTALAWINYNAPTSSHCQGIFGDFQSVSPGFELFGYNSAACALLSIDTSNLTWPAGYNSFPANRWEMVAATYNGSSGVASVYLNASVFASNSAFGKGLLLTQNIPYYIGDAPLGGSGTSDIFNGHIANMQLYATALSKSQINSLYQYGLSSLPLQNLNLVGWWPLDGNANDSSGGGNNGVMHSISFSNSKYFNLSYIPNYTLNSALFNGTASRYISGNNLYTFPFTSMQWVYPTSYISSSNQIISGFDGSTSLNQGTYQLEVSSTGNLMVYNGISFLTSNLIVPLNQWSLVGFGINAGSTTIYLNSANRTFFSISPSTTTSNTFWTIGKYFNGSVADVQVYSVALTNAQISQMYQQGLPLFGRVSVPLG